MQPIHFPYQRVIIVGVTSSGKSTLAKILASKFNLDFIELDAIHWLPNWQERPKEEFRSLVEQATHSQAWVLAGNYSSVRDITWPRAEAIIWLDYPFWTVFWRLWNRTWRRWWSRELLWGTNRENLWEHLLIWQPEKSLFRWLVDTYPRRKREYPLLFAQPEFAHLKIIHLYTPKETAEWLENLEQNF